MNCWRCHERVGGPVCAGCGGVQPPPAEPDHFAVLGLPRRWSLSAQEVDQAWRERNRLVHPDRFAGKSAVERRMSLQWTAAINGARRALREPVSRGWYLATGHARPREEGGVRLSPEFLEQVFEWQMEADSDPAGVRQQAEQAREAVMAELDRRFRAWEEGDRATPPPEVEELLARMKYLDNLAHMGAQDHA